VIPLRIKLNEPGSGADGKSDCSTPWNGAPFRRWGAGKTRCVKSWDPVDPPRQPPGAKSMLDGQIRARTAGSRGTARSRRPLHSLSFRERGASCGYRREAPIR
jgi:hypothetical protein